MAVVQQRIRSSTKMPREPSTGSQTDVGDKRGPVRHGPAHPAASERRRENEEAARAAFASGTGRGRLESIGKRPGVPN
ncbi:TPA: hypothetical protein ACH3X3_008657 [Trebouxia sp. C0006]